MQSSLDTVVLGEGPSSDAVVKAGEKCHSCILPSGFPPKVPSAPERFGLRAVTRQTEKLFTGAHTIWKYWFVLASPR